MRPSFSATYCINLTYSVLVRALHVKIRLFPMLYFSPNKLLQHANAAKFADKLARRI